MRRLDDFGVGIVYCRTGVGGMLLVLLWLNVGIAGGGMAVFGMLARSFSKSSLLIGNVLGFGGGTTGGS